MILTLKYCDISYCIMKPITCTSGVVRMLCVYLSITMRRPI